MYRKYFKRLIDIIVSGTGIIILSPIFLLLIIGGSIAMRGNPFFVQPRPGKDEKIFNLIKFRTMSNKKDSNGNLLPDDIRLNKYGRLLRSTSLDELPELVNIFIGDMSLIGPRPLLVSYLPYYSLEEHKRHSVRPGLSGLAQVNGRNSGSWEQKFSYDLTYVQNITFTGDIKIIIQTIYKTIKRSDILVGKEIPAGRLDIVRSQGEHTNNV